MTITADQPQERKSRVRGVILLTGFLVLTLPLMPVQAVLKRVAPKSARTFPHWYHRRVCGLLGLRIHQTGTVAKGSPVLFVANHSSWLDIPIISAIAPVSFIAKKEVGGWPGVSSLAQLQRSVFVDREKRLSVADTAKEVSQRLAAGDNLVLFAEGTSSDGNRLLPFRTSLFGAVKASGKSERGPATSAGNQAPVVQTLTVVYSKLHGVPLGRFDRALTGWYGDMDMVPHAWALLCAGPLDIIVDIGPPIALDSFKDRKALARHTEIEIRATLISHLRGERQTGNNAPTGDT